MFAKGAPVRIIGGSYTGGRQVFWYVAAASPVRRVQDLDGKAIGYSTTGSSTHAGLLALHVLFLRCRLVGSSPEDLHWFLACVRLPLVSGKRFALGDAR